VADAEFALSVLQARRRLAVKKHTRSAHGKMVKSDPTLSEYSWLIRRYQTEADVDRIVRFLLAMATRQDLATAHGEPASGLSPYCWHRRLSAEFHGSNRTLLGADRFYIMFDIDGGSLPEGSGLDQPQNLIGTAENAREVFLPPALRYVDLAVGAASSTGLKPGKCSLHLYAVLDRAAPLNVIYRWLAGAQKAGFPLDPKPALPGQLFLTGRPVFWGLDYPVPPSLYAFALPGRHRSVREINWSEYATQLAVYEAAERTAHAFGVSNGWKAYLNAHLGDGLTRGGFHKPLIAAIGFAVRAGEPVDEAVAAMRAIVVAHPDYAGREGQYTEQWLRSGFRRLRDQDAKRDAHIAGMLKRILPTMDFS
jgi:hypothetical protein